jgi:hypothetical protein
MFAPRKIFSILALVLTAPAFFSGVLFAKQQETPRRIAILVGVNEYDRPNLENRASSCLVKTSG